MTRRQNTLMKDVQDTTLVLSSMAGHMLSEMWDESRLAADDPTSQKTPEQWTTFLHNNRNPARTVAYRIPCERLDGAVFYDVEELKKYVEVEKQRRLGTVKLSPRVAEAFRAFGIGEAGGGTQGRRFVGGSANPQTSSTDGSVFVQMTIEQPLMVFAMTPEQAVAFGDEIAKAGRAALRIAEQGARK